MRPIWKISKLIRWSRPTRTSSFSTTGPHVEAAAREPGKGLERLEPQVFYRAHLSNGCECFPPTPNLTAVRQCPSRFETAFCHLVWYCRENRRAMRLGRIATGIK